MIDEFELPEKLGEVIRSNLRTIHLDVQAVELLVRAQAIQLEVRALLVASDANNLRRFHRDIEFEFIDGTTGDNGLEIIGGFDPTLWNESVIFTDGTTGDNGLQVTMPFHWGDDEFVTFTEDAYEQAYAIHNQEFVTFADFSVQYVLDFLTNESVKFSDLSVAWSGLFGGAQWAEEVSITESMSMTGGNTVALSESVNISEVMIGGPIVVFGDSVRWSELLTYVMDYQIQPENVTWVDALVVSVVAATDARPGAFVPGSALLGSPT